LGSDISPRVREAGDVEARLDARALTVDPDSSFEAWGRAW